MVDSYFASFERGERNISLESLEKVVMALDAEPIDAFRFGELEIVKGLEFMAGNDNISICTYKYSYNSNRYLIPFLSML